MSRSTKKGPFVDERLLKRIEGMNEKREKKVIKTWSRASTIFPDMVVIPSPSTTEENMFRYMSLRIW